MLVSGSLLRRSSVMNQRRGMRDPLRWRACSASVNGMAFASENAMTDNRELL